MALLCRTVLGSPLAIAALRIQYRTASEAITVGPSDASDTAGIGLPAVVVAAAVAVAYIAVVGFEYYLVRTWGWAGILPSSLAEVAVKLLN